MKTPDNDDDDDDEDDGDDDDDDDDNNEIKNVEIVMPLKHLGNFLNNLIYL